MKDLLGLLADAGLIERQGIEGGRPGAFVLALTPEGPPGRDGAGAPRAGASDRHRGACQEVFARRQASRIRGVAEAVDADTLARLKQWRTAEARRHGMPPYVIFHDRTLAELAAAHPRDLRRPPPGAGIGPAKLERYGDALLAVLAEG